MEALEWLKREHQVIERVLDLLEQAVERIETGRSVPEGFEPWVVQFIRQFADRCHHGKEEDVLFPLLEQRGIPHEGGPIGVMLHEHAAGRACVSEMIEAIQETPRSAHKFALAAARFATLLRQHIFKENNVLFPMAEHCLSDQDADVLDRFHAVEAEKGGREFHEQYESEVARWEAMLLE